MFVDNNLKIGGIQKAFINLLNEIRRDYDVSLLLFSNSGELIDQIPNETKIIHAEGLCRLLGITQDEANSCVKDRYSRGILALYSKLFSNALPIAVATSGEVMEQEFDYAISFMQPMPKHLFIGGTNEYVLKRINARERIAFVHCDVSKYGGDLRYLHKLYSQFDKIAICSESCKNQFDKTFPDLKSKTYCVRNCNNYKEIMTSANDNAFEYKDGLNIVTVARLSEEKEIQRGIKAIKYCVDKGIDVYYHIIGDGPERDNLLEYVNMMRLNNRVSFYGSQINPYKFMKNADILIITSRHEAAPLVIDEAICLNVPVFSTDTISAKEMILEKKCGWICLDCESFEEKLYEVLSAPEKIKEVKSSMPVMCNNNISIAQFKTLLGDL